MRNSGQKRNQNVRIKRPFMSFINDNDGVVLQQKIWLNLLQQDTISHKLDSRLLCIKELGIISYLVSDLLSKFGTQLFRDSLGQTYCCNSPWLSDSNQKRIRLRLISLCISELPSQVLCCSVNELWYLCTLAGACFSTNDGDDVVFDVLHDFSFVEDDGQRCILVLVQASDLWGLARWFLFPGDVGALDWRLLAVAGKVFCIALVYQRNSSILWGCFHMWFMCVRIWVVFGCFRLFVGVHFCYFLDVVVSIWLLWQWYSLILAGVLQCLLLLIRRLLWDGVIFFFSIAFAVFHFVFSLLCFERVRVSLSLSLPILFCSP